jgi:MFS family permease
LSSPPDPAARSGGVAELLAIRPYRLYWLTRIATQFASQMMMVALGWQMYELTGSAWDLGLVGLAQFAPALLMTLPAGHLADRWHRAHILFGSCLAETCVAAVLLAASHGHWAGRELILLLCLALGTIRAFRMPATQALPALLVPAEMLPRAVALGSSGMQLALITGPAIGGLLYALGADVVYGVCTGLIVVSAVLTLGIHHAPPPPNPEAASWTTVLAGVHFLWNRPVLLGAMSLDLFAVLFGGATALLPIFTKDILQTGSVGLGLLRGAPAVGALLCSVWLTRHPPTRRVGHQLIWAVALYGVAMLVFALVAGLKPTSVALMLALVALALSGAADMVSVVIRQTLVQLDTPDNMRGRVSAVNSVFIGASNQLGEFESGATAALLGPVGSVLLGGVAVLAIAGLWTRLFPTLWQRDRLRSDDTGG